MTKAEIILFWALSCFAALTVICGKLGMMLFGMGESPPTDPALAASWQRKRLWLALSELMAIPAFGTIAVTATIYLNLPAITSVAIAMGLGGLGFGFLLHGLQFFARRKLKMEELP